LERSGGKAAVEAAKAADAEFAKAVVRHRQLFWLVVVVVAVWMSFSCAFDDVTM
jgi:hypothetical protein